ncbi:hypothetical protein chiPu_0001641 [Chiloscyllium punctatum]|uniref:UPAR/Ly6 domain-containing protein n=1 Tax=Chiloscyllium punctatum TaxID=137246 RepID=A0A401RYL5_CHIPU|nr:hypothetical protein [Chiloscyllium punctatum]
MKFITAAIIVGLCFLTAETLKCYQCLNTRLIEECNSQYQLCPSNKSMCLTSVKTVGFSQAGLGIVRVTKKCSYHSECTADASDITIGGRKIFCCSTDFCNLDSSADYSRHSWILLGSIPTLAWTLLEWTLST